jgi:hypothetical protein
VSDVLVWYYAWYYNGTFSGRPSRVIAGGGLVVPPEDDFDGRRRLVRRRMRTLPGSNAVDVIDDWDLPAPDRRLGN